MKELTIKELVALPYIQFRDLREEFLYKMELTEKEWKFYNRIEKVRKWRLNPQTYKKQLLKYS